MLCMSVNCGKHICRWRRFFSENDSHASPESSFQSDEVVLMISSDIHIKPLQHVMYIHKTYAGFTGLRSWYLRVWYLRSPVRLPYNVMKCLFGKTLVRSWQILSGLNCWLYACKNLDDIIHNASQNDRCFWVSLVWWYFDPDALPQHVIESRYFYLGR